MGIGVSLFLLAAGAILAFAVNATVAGLDIQVIGWILIVVGALGLIVTLLIWGRRRSTVVERTATPRAAGRVVERDVYDDGPPVA